MVEWAQSLEHFREGEEVEVGNKSKGLKGSWFAATVVSRPPPDNNTPSKSAGRKSLKKKVFVQYHTLLENATTCQPLREYVQPSMVRPKPPQEEIDRPFEVYEKVDAYSHDGWWEGSISAVLEDQRYRVYFKDFNEEMEFQRSELRSHLDWIDAKWIRLRREEIVVSPGQAQSQPEKQRVSTSQAQSQPEKQRISPTLAEIFGKCPLMRCSKNHRKRKSQAQEQQMQLKPIIEKGALLGGTLIEKQKVDGVKKQYRNVFKRRKSSEQKLPCTGAPGKAGLRKTAGSTYPFPATESGARDLHPALDSPLFVRFEEAITEIGISHGTQSVVDFVNWATSKDIPTRDTELGKSFDRVENLPSSSGTATLLQIDQAMAEEHDQCVGILHVTQHVVEEVTSKDTPIRGIELRKSFYMVENLPSSSGTQHVVEEVTSKDTPIRGIELRKSLDMVENLPSSSGTAALLQIDQATSEEHNHCVGILHGTQPVVQFVEDVTSKDAPTRGSELRKSIDTVENLLISDGTVTLLQIDQATAEEHNQCVGILHGTQPVVKEVTSKDTPIGGIELRKSFNMVENLPSSSGTATLLQIDQAASEEHNQCVMEAFLIDSVLDDNLPLVGEGLPFVKRSSFWNTVGEMDAFRLIPQHIDFRSLEKFSEYHREGIAIGSIVTYDNLVKDIAKTQFSDHVNVLQERYKVLDDLEGIGFNVQPLRTRLDKLSSIKAKHGQLNHDLLAAEEQLHLKQINRNKLMSMLDNINEKKKVLEEQINQLNKELESAMIEEQIEGSNVSLLEVTVNTIRELIGNTKLEFDREAAAPW